MHGWRIGNDRGRLAAMNDVFRFVHPRLVGTFVTVTLAAVPGVLDERDAAAIDDSIVHEFERLEQIFSVFRPDSELERWKRGEVDVPSLELQAALGEALDWQHRSGGAFHTASGAVIDVWRRSVDRGSVPTPVELAAAVALLDNDPYTIDGTGVPVPAATAQWVNLNAFVKGWIVDRVASVIFDDDSRIDGLTINAGGDLRHRGTEPIVVGIENPLRPYDNEPPLIRIAFADGAVATSGGARRGFQIGDRLFSHVIDPRTGQSVERFASVTIVARDAATADVLATVVGLADTDTVLDLADEYAVAAMIVLPDGTQLRNDRFGTLVTAS